MVAGKTVLIVARSVSLRDGLRALFMTIPRIDGIVDAADAASALNVVGDLRPLVVVLDAGSLAPAASSLLNQIKIVSPETKRIVIAETVQQMQAIKSTDAESVFLQGVPGVELVEATKRFLA